MYMRGYKVTFRFIIQGVVKVPAGEPEPKNGSVWVEAEDEGEARDEAEAYLFNTYGECQSLSGIPLKPTIISVEECKNSIP